MNQSKIFIIDDNEELCESLQFLFSTTYELQPQIYYNPQVFLEEFSQENTGCLIVDIFMPYMNGLDLIKRVKEINKKVKIIILSGNGGGNTASKALEAGADAFIKKPFGISELLDKVSAFLNK
ncbi:response regulator [Fluoribacter dumoffii]|uniref:Mycobacterial persistence regulator A n=1 Tax=Fluoribacter dumoffii TaxID=463 RepID=A0A377G893_9GAMM|nr:response regulator [Fluoribacter dumoffii]KTC89848.1 two component response regulator [Fluoribacter dumoffii NY 23]MCW8385144.1 response regulator [Fluoribacter dumoffii]MCW8418200.1 response regulator [Fluoribacter dumoffii]MCW8453958.1 response regulator [Fluoribacter dumoffii]MCW8461971.1 response regulator [Fluoribacter dumoffii]